MHVARSGRVSWFALPSESHGRINVEHSFLSCVWLAFPSDAGQDCATAASADPHQGDSRGDAFDFRGKLAGWLAG